MAILDPAVVVEDIINTGFQSLVTNVATQVPLILSQFPQAYIDAAIEYLTAPDFKIETVFQYAYDPAHLPCWNIVLAAENENAGNQQMFLNDTIDAADMNPNTSDFEEHGSLWAIKINIYVRAQKERQCIVLYNLTKWILLNNRLTFEDKGIITPIFSGSDIAYEVERKPTFVFTRALSITGRAANTIDTNITTDPTLQTVQSAWPTEVTILEQTDLSVP